MRLFSHAFETSPPAIKWFSLSTTLFFKRCYRSTKMVFITVLSVIMLSLTKVIHHFHKSRLYLFPISLAVKTLHLLKQVV